MGSKSYSYEVSVQAGNHLALDAETGGVNVLDGSDSFVAGFAAPWAKDANGVEVPTHYELAAGQLVQVVDHTSGTFAYPITADPWFGIRLIDRVAWVGQSLHVYPTWWGRTTGYAARWAAWAEVVQKMPRANRPNMADQFYCHWDYVRFKPTWNLDMWRPYVGYWQTVLRGCNP